jgi:hypothetical protein
MRNVSEKFRGIQKSRFTFITFYRKKIVAFCEIMRKNILEPYRAQITMQYGACVLHAG